MSLKFERIEVFEQTAQLYGGSLYRARVPGGWLVVFKFYGEPTPATTFYPDPEHSWDGNSLPAPAPL